jgi:hypothetical protein
MGGLPPDAVGYTALIGGLIAEHRRHPELIETFRTALLLPRRATAISVIERGQSRGDIRDDAEPEMLLDMFAGPILARAFAGRDTGPEWRERALMLWWELVAAPNS